MSNDSQRVPLATPDFATNKQSLKDFLKGQDELKDYDFEGSVLSVVLDTLAYNSHMNAFYLNMVGNEAFLNTAVRRNSVVNNAKDLGYTPKSAISAKASLQLEYTPTGTPASSIVVPKGTMYGSSSGAEVFVFNTIDDYVANYNSTIGKYVINDLPIYEGKRLTHIFTVTAEGSLATSDTTSDVTRLGVSLPNINVDTTSMKVFVNVPALGTEYVRHTEFDHSLALSSDTRVYFVNEDENECVNVSFGDGILGYKPPVGSNIKVEYLISSGNVANGIGKFSAFKEIPGTTLTYIGVNFPAGGGTKRETIDSIKYNAVRSFESAGRGVTAEDYAHLAKIAYPSAKAVISWGGQENVPPANGKVFISIQPPEGAALSTEQKNSIKDYLTSAGMVTIFPEIVDPDFIYVDTTTLFKYEKSKSSILAGELETAIKNQIVAYNDRNLNTFASALRYSNLLSTIDNTDNGIVANATSLKLIKRFYVNLGVKTQGTLSYDNAIIPGSLTSTNFKYSSFNNCSFTATSNGTLNIVNIAGGISTVIVSNAGLVDYENGIISINPIAITDANDAYFDDLLQSHFIRMIADPVENNVSAARNQIITIENISATGTSV